MPDPVSATVDTTPSQTPPTTPAPSSAAPPAPAQAAPPASTPPSSQPVQPASPDAGTASAGLAGPAPGQPAAQPAQPSWLQNLRQQGVDLGGDENAALQQIRQLSSDLQQLRPLAPHVSAYMQHAGAFQQYLAGLNQQQQAKQPDANAPWYKDLWNPPEYNEAWRGLLRKDEQGNIVALPGAPPDIVPKYLAYENYRREQAEKLMSNPFAFFEKAIDTRAKDIATKIVSEQFGQHRDLTSSQSFVNENSNWIYERDPQGQVKTQLVLNPQTGQYINQPVFSQFGQRFVQCVQQEQSRQQSRGYIDVEEQKRNALRQVQLEDAIHQLDQMRRQTPGAGGAPAAPISPQQQANNAFLAQHNPAAAPANLPVNGNTNHVVPPVTRMNLADMLKANFRANGITDDVLANSN